MSYIIRRSVSQWGEFLNQNINIELNSFSTLYNKDIKFFINKKAFLLEYMFSHPNQPKDKLERINPKSNFFNFIPGMLWRIARNIKHQHLYFFDTNIIVRKNDALDGRVKKFRSFNRSFAVTNVIKNEVEEKITTNQFSWILNKKIKVFDIQKILLENPYLCPTYYNFYASMYNPANILSPSFPIELIMARKMRAKQTTKEEQDFFIQLMNWTKKSTINMQNIFGENKDPFQKYLDNAIWKNIQKKKDNIKKKNKNFYNDLRNLSFVLMYTLFSEKNVYLVTSDHDIISYLFTWAESVSQELAFKQMILESLGEEGRREIFRGRKLTYYLDTKKFSELANGLLYDLLNYDWKKSGYCFRIKFWDKEKQKYFNSIYFNFDNTIRENLLNLHGQLSCPCAQNNIYGNWIRYKWWPPMPPHNMAFIKVLVFRKDIINKNSTKTVNGEHEKMCKYVNMDRENELSDFSGFLV